MAWFQVAYAVLSVYLGLYGKNQSAKGARGRKEEKEEKRETQREKERKRSERRDLLGSEACYDYVRD